MVISPLPPPSHPSLIRFWQFFQSSPHPPPRLFQPPSPLLLGTKEHAMNEKRLLSDLNKNPSVFAKPNDSNLAANGGNGYDHNEGQYGRYGYDHQADNLYDENGYDHADSQYGRYGYDHQADNQHNGNGHDHADSQNGRYVYDHQADNQYVNGYDHADYQYSGNERNHRADDEYGGCMSHQADNEGYGVTRRIGSNERHNFCGDDSYICSKYF